MVFNATFNNISFISWRSVLLVEETGGPGENHRPPESYCQPLSYNVLSSKSRLCGIRDNVSEWNITELALNNNHSLTLLVSQEEEVVCIVAKSTT